MTESQQLWCSYGLRVTMVGPAGRVVTDVDQPFARVGSHERSEVRLAKGTADKRALYLHATEFGVFFVELRECSRGLGQRGWLPPGGVVEVGPYRMSAELTNEGHLAQVPEPAEPFADLCAFGAEGPSHPNLEIYYQGVKITEVELRRRLSLVGRRPPCVLRIREGHVSTCHGVFYWRNKTLWFIDLLSGNGSMLNGRPVDATRVLVGDRLDLGSAELRFTEIASPLHVEPLPRLDNRLETGSGPPPSDFWPPDASPDGRGVADEAPRRDAAVARLAPAFGLPPILPPAASPIENELLLTRLKEAEAERTRLIDERKALAEERRLLEAARQDLERKRAFDIEEQQRHSYLSVHAAAPPSASAEDEKSVLLRDKRWAVEDSPQATIEIRAGRKPIVKPDPPNELLAAGEPDGQLDEGLAYVMGRLAERETKDYRRKTALRWLAAALVFALAAAAIAAVTIFKITRSV